MRVRALEPGDRAEWLRLLAGLYPDTHEKDHAAAVDAYIAGDDLPELLPAVVLVIDEGAGRLSGLLELSVRDYAEGCSGPTPYVESWFVDEWRRGTGAGAALMRAAEDWARARGYAEMASDALEENLSSHAAHAALGFEEVERVVHFRKVLAADGTKR